MYNKLFTKILDSSIWLEAMPTRIVWLTLIAAMDQDGFAQFSAVGNVAARARVTDDEARAAIQCLESPDPDSNDPDNDGRRIERVQGGWMVLNASKYRDLVTRTVAREQTRLRVQKHREHKASNAALRNGNASVTPSEAEAEAYSDPVAQNATGSAEPSPDDSAPIPALLLTFPTTGRGPKTWALTEAYVSDLKSDYPGLDVLAECRKARAWCVANPKKQKTSKGMPAFLVNWLNRAVKDGSGQRRVPDVAMTPSHPRPEIGSWRDDCQREHGGHQGDVCGTQAMHHARMQAGWRPT